MRLAWFALRHCVPDVWVDTTGCAFTFAVAKCLYGCKVLAYVHYPTISTDMLQVVWERRPTAAHQPQSTLTTYLKLLYYLLFAFLYGLVGRCANWVWPNSTWTANHVRSLWRCNSLRILYPPCRVASHYNTRARQPVVVSIGQFRPEKDHLLQLQAFERLLSSKKIKTAKLVLIGSCRGAADQGRLEELRAKVASSEVLRGKVEFCVNQKYAVLEDWMAKASVGLHTVRASSVCWCDWISSLFLTESRCGTNTLALALSK